MDFSAFLQELRTAPGYSGQIVHVREEPAREARFAEPARPLHPSLAAALRRRGVERLYTHQARALDLAREGRDVLLTTGPASGKSLCYTVPILEGLLEDPNSRALLLFPTKALSQDQLGRFRELLQEVCGEGLLAGVYDGDTPARLRRKLRDRASVIFTNPDMLHAGLLPHHPRWGGFLSGLKLLVLDELHVYNGIFGANVANLLRRLRRVCRHHGSEPRIVASSATIANPEELALRLTGREMELVSEDGSPRGRRTTVFWNPPRVRETPTRSRRSANVEAHELMAALVLRGVPTITFSKAKMTAELIHRYVTETLRQSASGLAGRVAAYRGGYLSPERREIEQRLFKGELLGVSTTRALELGIDVGDLDASIVVGYPGTLAAFFQQAGRAGRRGRDSLVVLVGLDTPINQYVMSHPEYIFGRPVERAVVEPDNPFVLLGHLRCASHELPLAEEEVSGFGPQAQTVLEALEANRKVRHLSGRWYHAAAETPQHEVPLRCHADDNVVIQDVSTGRVLAEMPKFDAQPILHPEAIYLHHGDTYRVLELDLDRNVARVQRVEVDYYTQPKGGTDVHHIDHRLREKPFGTGKAYWGEVTADFFNDRYERIHFYTLDAISEHGLDLPHYVLETLAFWLEPPESLMAEVARLGLSAHQGLRGIGYATRMVLPLFMTCDTLDFSHTVGSVNSSWHTLFVYERYNHGMGYTETAYDLLHEVMPAVLDHLRRCDCRDGCPCCVGKPLRQYTVWNVERGEGSIASRTAAIFILERLLGDGSRLRCPDTESLTGSEEAAKVRLERALRRRLSRMREPEVGHLITPVVRTEYPEPEHPADLDRADAARRSELRRDLARELRRRLARKDVPEGLPPTATSIPQPGLLDRPRRAVGASGGAAPPAAAAARDASLRPSTPSSEAVSGAAGTPPDPPSPDAAEAAPARGPRLLGDDLASRARKLKRAREKDE